MVRRTVLLKIQSVLAHFKNVELNRVYAYFPDGTRETVLRELESAKERESKKNVILLLLKKVENETMRYLHTLHIGLCSFDISLHSRKKLWLAYEMKNPEDQRANMKNLDEIIKQGCRMNKIHCDVQCLKRGEIIWFTLIEKVIKRNKSLSRCPPIFCATVVRNPYIFFSRNVKKSIIMAIVHALSYKSFKKLQLSGHDILSLLTLLNRNKGSSSTAFVPHYVESEPRKVVEGIDYLQHENRREFANKCLDVDATLETVTFVGSNVTWQGLSHIPNMAGHRFPCSLTISSPNIFSTMKQLMERNVIDPKTCSTYMKTFSRTGKNVIELEEESEESVDEA